MLSQNNLFKGRALQFCRNEAEQINWRKFSLVLSPNELIVCTAMRLLQRISSPIEIYFRAKILACIWLSWNLEKRRRPGWTNRTMGSKCLWSRTYIFASETPNFQIYDESKSPVCTKGQLISKGNFSVFNSPKNRA